MLGKKQIKNNAELGMQNAEMKKLNSAFYVLH